MATIGRAMNLTGRLGELGRYGAKVSVFLASVATVVVALRDIIEGAPVACRIWSGLPWCPTPMPDPLDAYLKILVN